LKELIVQGIYSILQKFLAVNGDKKVGRITIFD